MTHEFMNLPAGVDLEPGRISLTFDQPQQALEKLLALAMARVFRSTLPYAYVACCRSRRAYDPRGYRLSLEEQSFLASWKRAQEYQLRQSEAEECTQKQLRAAVNLEYIQQLSARLDSDEKLIDQLAAELKGRHLKPRRKPGR